MKVHLVNLVKSLIEVLDLIPKKHQDYFKIKNEFL